MGGLKTYFAMLALLGAQIGAPTAWAGGGTAYQQFATCAGRLSAEIEHLWLLPGPDAQAQVYFDKVADERRIITGKVDHAIIFCPPGKLPWIPFCVASD